MESHENNNIALDANALLTSSTSTINEGGLLQSHQEVKHSELTIGAFFDFMRIAYQVNDDFEDLTSILNANSEIDWYELAKINLDLRMNQDDQINEDSCNFNTERQENKGNDAKDYQLIQKSSNKEVNPCKLESVPNSQCSTASCNINSGNKYSETIDIEHENNIDSFKVKVHGIAERKRLSENQKCDEEEKLLQPKDCLEENEHVLAKVMETNLRDILHEGLLDSVLPYMLVKITLSQPIIKQSGTTVDIKKNSSLSSVVESKTIRKENKDKEINKINKKSLENDVEIHVYDEDKNIRKNFRCPQKLLIQKMCYFADVTAGQKFDQMDISVRCDIVIFDWLMRWVKKDITSKSEWPVLEANNVVPIMMSACFLQMEPLLKNCLQYCHDNMSEILKTSTILTCLDDNFLTRLVELFSNEDVEMLKDKQDKIQSRLFCKLIALLMEVTPDNKKGHYSSSATLFKCGRCDRNVIASISDFVPCIPNAMRIDNKGVIHNKHVRNLIWTLNDYIITLRSKLHSWRKVYWRLWGDCHFLYCQQCHMYFPINQIDWCCYHPESAQFFVNEQQRSTPFPLGRYSCCSQRAYKFEALTNQGGCKYKEHIPDIRNENELNMLNILAAHREIITIEPPQLSFPEKITRLVTHQSSLRPGKLVCNDKMWWNGIELVSQRSKLGLLGKIWGGSGFRRLLQAQDSQKSMQKLRRQISVSTGISSPNSSIAGSDEDDAATSYEDSSTNEDSYDSEETNALCTSKTITAKHLTNQKCHGRYWNSNLNIRHNQDNQRDFEEKTVTQMITLLTKRTITENLLSKSYKKHHGFKTRQPIVDSLFIVKDMYNKRDTFK